MGGELSLGHQCVSTRVGGVLLDRARAAAFLFELSTAEQNQGSNECNHLFTMRAHLSGFSSRAGQPGAHCCLLKVTHRTGV